MLHQVQAVNTRKSCNRQMCYIHSQIPGVRCVQSREKRRQNFPQNSEHMTLMVFPGSSRWGKMWWSRCQSISRETLVYLLWEQQLYLLKHKTIPPDFGVLSYKGSELFYIVVVIIYSENMNLHDNPSTDRHRQQQRNIGSLHVGGSALFIKKILGLTMYLLDDKGSFSVLK